MPKLQVGGASVGPELLGPWRDELCLQAARASTVVYGLGTGILSMTVSGTWQRLALTCAGLLSCVMVGIVAVADRPKGELRVWFVVVPSVLASLAGFVAVGFLAGPAVVLTVTMMIGGLLLGRRAMLLLLAVVILCITGIAWAMTHAIIPAPSLQDVAMTRVWPWVRTLSLMFLAIGLLGSVLLEMVTRLERSIDQLGAETRRREEAEQAKSAAEMQALANKQLEAVGQLAAGVAHDFNNNLAVIIGSAELLRTEHPVDAVSKELIDDILQSSRSAAQLTRQLLAYSRKGQMVLVPTHLHRLIDGTVSLLRRSIDPRVEIVTRLEAEDCRILADASALDNALLNLLVNARDAMPKGGTLTIATANQFIEPGSSPDQGGLAGGRYVLVEVLDTGDGIAKEVLPRVFEPFFTTKPVGKGTGLGLAAVIGTVKSLKGSIEVESELCCGTVFRILLPCCEATQVSVEADAQPQIVRGRGHVLLVEDDLRVRRSATATLTSLGYEVTAATDGLHALEIYQSPGKRIDLVILDLRMPRLDGEATFDRLHHLEPQLPVLIWSGHGGEQDIENMLERGAVGYIQKPFRIAEFSHVVRDAMELGRQFLPR